MRVIRVLVCDEMASVRDTLGRIFVLRRDFELTGKAGSLRDLLDALADDRPDIVLTCLELPDAQGPDIVRHVRERAPDVKVVAYGADPAAEQGVRDAGGSDYLHGSDFRLDTLAAMMQRALDEPAEIDLTERDPAEA